MLRFAWLILLSFPVSGLAQLFYQPVEYEFRTGGTLYFYGGEQRAVHDAAAEPFADGAAWGRQNGFAFSSASVGVGREVDTQRIRVFSDHWRSGLEDATLNGFTIADARNEAYANTARYFRKSDLVAQAVQVDGGRVVSPRAGSLTIRKSSGERVSPAEPQPLMILPRPPMPPANPTNSQAAVD